MGGCSVREHERNGFAAVTLENDALAATFLPGRGAELHALVDKARGVDLLWKSPWNPGRQPASLPLAEAGSEAAWLDQYGGGWQFLFPNAGDACEYRGARLNFHGEASVRQWDYQVVRHDAAAVEVRFELATSRGPFHVIRTIRVERGRPVILFEESIRNLGEEDHHYMWGHHPAFGAPFLDEGCRLTIPARRYLAHDVEISEHARVAAGTRGSWPLVPGRDGTPVDLSVWPERGRRVTEFGYLCELDAGWYALQNGALGLGFGLAWPKEVFPYVWFWQELRGSFGYPWYGRSYVAAVEPFTSMPGSGLVKAIECGTAPLLRAGANVNARLAAVLLGPEPVHGISIDGEVASRAG
ncbi:MAG: aldose 1-epimerase [Acidobacteria bacterium]|nr:aldose 1-epimerase [Acidobacteriota bacterium]